MRAFTESHQIGLWKILVKSMIVYATMQPGLLAAAPSMGVEGVGSNSRRLEVAVKSEAKKSIGVCVCGWRDATNLSKDERIVSHPFYTS